MVRHLSFLAYCAPQLRLSPLSGWQLVVLSILLSILYIFSTLSILSILSFSDWGFTGSYRITLNDKSLSKDEVNVID